MNTVLLILNIVKCQSKVLFEEQKYKLMVDTKSAQKGKLVGSSVRVYLQPTIRILFILNNKYKRYHLWTD